MKAIIDTNVLIYIFTQRVDVFTQLRELGFKKFLFPEQIISELKSLERSLDGKERIAARFALQLIERCKDCIVKRVDAKGDEAIIKLAKEEDAVIISNDKELRRKAKKQGILTGYLRELKFVEIEDF